ncbi:MAG TPA: cytochrome c [Chloroflexota bacterium]
MRGSRATGWGLFVGALLLAGVLVIGLYAWDSGARTAEAALRPPPVAPLAPALPTPSLPLRAASPVASPATSGGLVLAGDATAGQPAFAAHCNSCHPGANAGIGPALYGPQVAERYPDDGALVAVIRQGKGGMPGFSSDQLSDQDLTNIIAYLHGLGSGTIAPEPTPTPRPRRGSG